MSHDYYHVLLHYVVCNIHLDNFKLIFKKIIKNNNNYFYFYYT